MKDRFRKLYPQHIEHRNDIGEIFGGLASGDLHRDKLAERMLEMDRKYPGKGWAEEAAKLQIPKSEGEKK